MKVSRRFPGQVTRRSQAVLLAAVAGLTGSAIAAEETNAPPQAVAPNAPAQVTATNAPAETATTNAAPKEAEPKGEQTAAKAGAAAAALTPEQMFEGGTNAYNNWIEFGTGGFITHGNKAQSQQWHQMSGGAFGGIEDFHYQADLKKGTTMSVDGRALFDEDDYKLRLEITKEKLGYLRFSYNQFRTWYNGDGGFYSPARRYYPLSDDALGLDRGEFSFEGGLTLEDLPKVTFKYAHSFREGDKSSTIWGTAKPALNITRSLSPSVWGIDERSDSFQLDITHQYKATDYGVGFRFETGTLDNSLLIDQGRNDPAERRITDRQGTTYDMFNVHAFTETWIKKNLMFSTAYSYSDLNNDISGSRIYGDQYNVVYSPNPTNGLGYFNLDGGSRLHEYVMDMNLFYKPIQSVSVVPSIRVQKEVWDADSTATETLSDYDTARLNANSERSLINVRERLDLTYSGLTNWVFYGRGEFTEEQGDQTEVGGLVAIRGFGVPPITRQTDDREFAQKYSLGARWYPTRRVTIDLGGYYKKDSYDYDNNRAFDSTANTTNSANRYPAYLVMQNFDTYDGNVRFTLRPRLNLTLVSRYDFQYSTINTQPDPISTLSEVESARMTSHILGQDVSWAPFSRVYFQAGFNYVLSETDTPADSFNPSLRPILQAQNNYWTVNFTTGLVLDDRTDLKLGYFYYRADNFEDNSNFGVPYGSGAEEHGVTATLVRKLSKNVRLTLRYAYSQYEDQAFGGNQDFNAHMISSSLQYRF